MIYAIKPYVFIFLALATLPLSHDNRVGLVSSLLLLGCGAAIVYMRKQSRPKTSHVRIR
ncbi:MAG: hypothetical protein H6626_10165 [Pseudobdellovibrionaceae bacterium]|mgnify:CR=1 FL=1|nr:hypothetical protein [Bdellovibrionales bacterium]USN46577.1 MAG: hypothetical protein H6626_10165 [Pseudobdellovibrionaceae bacterium]